MTSPWDADDFRDCCVGEELWDAEAIAALDAPVPPNDFWGEED